MIGPDPARCGTCHWFNPEFAEMDTPEESLGLCQWPAERLPISMTTGNRERRPVGPLEGEKCPCYVPRHRVVTNYEMISFTVRVIRRGDKYGLTNSLTHDKDDPLVEFYDRRFDHTPGLGQFVSRYFLSDLLKRPLNTGVLLDGGVPEWSLGATAMNFVRAWLREVSPQ